MASKSELIKREYNVKVIKSAVRNHKKEVERVSDAMATMYTAALKDRLVLDLLKMLIKDLESDSEPKT